MMYTQLDLNLEHKVMLEEMCRYFYGKQSYFDPIDEIIYLELSENTFSEVHWLVFCMTDLSYEVLKKNQYSLTRYWNLSFFPRLKNTFEGRKLCIHPIDWLYRAFIRKINKNDKVSTVV